MIAAFCGGLLFGRMARAEKEELLQSAEAAGDLLSMVTWTVFGAAVVGPSLHAFSWEVVLYALLSLTVVRMLTVFLCPLGTSLTTRDKLFMGWFSHCGLASIVFAVIVLGEHLHGVAECRPARDQRQSAGTSTGIENRMIKKPIGEHCNER